MALELHQLSQLSVGAHKFRCREVEKLQKRGGGGKSESAMLVGDDIMTRAPNRQLKYQLQCLGRPV